MGSFYPLNHPLFEYCASEHSGDRIYQRSDLDEIVDVITTGYREQHSDPKKTHMKVYKKRYTNGKVIVILAHDVSPPFLVTVITP